MLGSVCGSIKFLCNSTGDFTHKPKKQHLRDVQDVGPSTQFLYTKMEISISDMEAEFNALRLTGILSTM